tara:strand:+ start:190 stop:531 length:342 start_codon:yes stop_codon:yes gene_type:complete
MKTTLSTYQIADALKNDESGGWSYEGALAMAEHLEELEDDIGEEFELDVVAIRCDYSEFNSLQEWARGYFIDWKKDLEIENEDNDEIDDLIREHIQDYGQLIEFSSGVIVSSF